MFEHLVINARLVDLFGHFAHARQHAHDPFHAAHFHHLFQLGAQVIHVELALLEPFHHAFGLFSLNRFLGLFNQGHDIAHTQDAASDPIRFKGFKGVHFFAQTNKSDGFTRNGPHRQGRTTAAIAVHPR